MNLYEATLWAEWSHSLLFATLFKGSLLLVVAAGVARVLAEARRLTWGLALAGLGLLPVLELTTGVWSLRAPWSDVLTERMGEPNPGPLVHRPSIGLENPSAEAGPGPVGTEQPSSEGQPAGGSLEVANSTFSVSITLEDETASPKIGPGGRADSRTVPSGSPMPTVTFGDPVPRAARWATAWLPILATGAVPLVWIGGVLAGWCRCALEWVTLEIRRRRSEAVPAEIAAMAREIARDLRLRGPVEVRMADGSRPAVAWGWWRPIVLLPAAAARWSTGRIRSELQFQLAGVKGDHWRVAQLGRLITGVHWMNPLAWWACRELCAEQQLGQDERVLATAVDPTAYTQEQVTVLWEAGANPGSRRSHFARRGSERLERRLTALLDSRPPARRPGRQTSLLATLAALLAVATLGTLRFTPADTADGHARAILPTRPATLENLESPVVMLELPVESGVVTDEVALAERMAAEPQDSQSVSRSASTDDPVGVEPLPWKPLEGPGPQRRDG